MHDASLRRTHINLLKSSRGCRQLRSASSAASQSAACLARGLATQRVVVGRAATVRSAAHHFIRRRADEAGRVNLLDAGLAKVNSVGVVDMEGAVEDDDSESGDDDDDDDDSAEYWTPLHVAAHVQNIQAATFLLDRGADPNFVAYTGKYRTPLMVAVISDGHNADLVNLMIGRGANVNAIGPNGATALHFACDIGSKAAAVALVKAGGDRALKDDEGATAEEVAREHGNTELLSAISEIGDPKDGNPSEGVDERRGVKRGQRSASRAKHQKT